MSKHITIAGTSLTEFHIIVRSSVQTELEAGSILTKELHRTIGIALPVCIKAERTDRLILFTPLPDMSKEGVTVAVRDGNLYLWSERKLTDALYYFLTKWVGWRYLHEDISILKDGDVDLSEGFTDHFVPPFEYRQLDWICAQDPEWMRANHVNYRGQKWIGFVHTLAGLSERGDQTTQPCLSDPEVLATVKKNVRKILSANPDCKILSVSQNDNMNPCKCPKCLATDEEEGSPAGTLLRFVNAVADDIREDYPDVSIETLAYQYTRKAPKITRPRDNVIIRLCSIECCFSHDLGDASCEVNGAFIHDITEWSKICRRLYIWDYVTDFSYYIPPFPNFRVLRSNMEFFARHNVVGMYPEGNYQSNSGEFAELRAYLLAQCMWNPYMTEEAYQEAIDDFCIGYYGAGGVYVKKFLDFVCEASSGRHFNIWTPPFGIVPEEVYRTHFTTIENWWNAAEAAAENDTYLKRITKSRLQWTYVKLMLNPDPVEGEAFFRTVESLGIRWNEWRNFKADPDFSLSPTEWT